MTRQRSSSSPSTPPLTHNGGGGGGGLETLEESVSISLCHIQIVDFEVVHTSLKPYTVYVILSRQEKGKMNNYIFFIFFSLPWFLDGKTSTLQVRR